MRRLLLAIAEVTLTLYVIALVASPALSFDPHTWATDYWGEFQGNVIGEGAYLELTKDANLPPGDDYSYMYMTTRFSTDGRPPRQTPKLSIRWRETNGQSSGSNDRVRLRIAWRPVFSNASGGGVGNWAFDWGAMCYDEHAGDQWENCQTTFTVGDYEVQDIRAHIYNSTNGRIQIEDIDFQDGDT
jgi:hypothetical protein